ncbi:MAG: hypothetical protein QXZ43_02765 [Candidatus Aenigmatarchaeota archaeon]
MKKNIIFNLIILFFLNFFTVSAQQSHPLSEITPINSNLNMNSYNITGINYLGIGVSTPEYKIDSSGSAWIRPNLYIGTNKRLLYDTGSALGISSAVLIEGNLNLNGYQLLNTLLGNDMDGNSNSIVNLNWLNATNIKASKICINNDCLTNWGSTSGNGWVSTNNYIYNDTSNVKVGIGTSNPTKTLEIVGDINSTGIIYGNEIRIGGGFSSNGLTIDSSGNILTSGNLTYSGYTYIIDTLRYNGSLEAPYKIKGGYIYPGLCDTGESCMQTSRYIFDTGSAIKINGNGEIGGSLTIDNGLTVSTGTISLPADQIDSNEVSFNYAGSTSKGGPASDLACTDCVALGSETTGNYVAGLTQGEGIIISGTAGEGWSPTVSVAFGTDFLGWQNLTAYPPACPAGQFINQLGDTIVCGTPNVGSGSVTGSGTVGYIAMWNDSSSINNSIIYQSSGNIGIGTTSPSSKLEVLGTINATNFYDIDNSQYYLDPSGSSIVNNFQVASGVLSGANNEQINIGSTDNIITFVSGGQENMRIHSNNNIGIGTASPDSKLHIIGGVCIESTDSGCSQSSGSLKATTIYQGNNQVIDTISQSDPISVSGTGNSRTIGLNYDSYFTLSGSSLSLANSGVTQGVYGDGTKIPQITIDAKGRITSATNVTITENDPQVGTVNTGYVCYGSSSTVQCADAGIQYSTSTDRLTVGALTVDTNTLFVDSTNDKVGIGTLIPLAKLEIQGSGTGGLSLNVTGDLYVNDTSGNVGIGTANPSQRLEVYGNIAGDNSILIKNINQWGYSSLIFGNDISGLYVYTGLGGSSSGTNFANRGVFESNSQANGLSFIVDKSTGDMRFYIGGSSDSNEVMRINSTNINFRYNNENKGRIYLVSDSIVNGPANSVVSDLNKIANGTIRQGQVFNMDSQSGWIRSVTFALQQTSTGCTVNDLLYAEIYSWNENQAQADLFPLARSKSVPCGIVSTTGITNVTFYFQYPVYLNQSMRYMVALHSPAKTIRLKYSNANPYTSGGAVSSVKTSTDYYWTSESATDDLFFNITLGQSNNYGTLYIGNINTVDADVAEYYPTEDNLSPGDLVSINYSKNLLTPFAVKKAEKGENVIGVVSVSPGIAIGNKENENDVPIALIGRVPVKVSAENGVIKIGDPLTLSEKYPGVATKSNKEEKIIGYALNEYSDLNGIGIIEAIIQPGWHETGEKIKILEEKMEKIIKENEETKRKLNDLELLLNKK